MRETLLNERKQMSEDKVRFEEGRLVACNGFDGKPVIDMLYRKLKDGYWTTETGAMLHESTMTLIPSTIEQSPVVAEPVALPPFTPEVIASGMAAAERVEAAVDARIAREAVPPTVVEPVEQIGKPLSESMTPEQWENHVQSFRKGLDLSKTPGISAINAAAGMLEFYAQSCERADSYTVRTALEVSAWLETLSSKPVAPAGAWIVWYEDTEMPPEHFSDESSAVRMYRHRLENWACHLFKRVDVSEVAPAGKLVEGLKWTPGSGAPGIVIDGITFLFADTDQEVVSRAHNAAIDKAYAFGGRDNDQSHLEDMRGMTQGLVDALLQRDDARAKLNAAEKKRDEYSRHLNGFQDEVWKSLGKYSDQLGWGLTGIQPECWSLLDDAIVRLAGLEKGAEGEPTDHDMTGAAMEFLLAGDTTASREEYTAALHTYKTLWRAHMKRAIAAAVAEEREACEKLAEEALVVLLENNDSHAASEVGEVYDAIRARSTSNGKGGGEQ